MRNEYLITDAQIRALKRNQARTKRLAEDGLLLGIISVSCLTGLLWGLAGAL